MKCAASRECCLPAIEGLPFCRHHGRIFTCPEAFVNRIDIQRITEMRGFSIITQEVARQRPKDKGPRMHVYGGQDEP